MFKNKQSVQRRDCVPQDDESQDDFIERCTDEGYDEDECQVMWDDSDAGDKSTGDIIIKTSAHKPNGRDFVLSDETQDRMGDIIEADGWLVDGFKSNPIALFGHRSDFPIGTWDNVHTNKQKQLRGTLQLAPKGTSPRIDELHALVDAGILRAVSVGFKPIKHVPIDVHDPWAGSRFIEQELIECSLVAVPANPNALAVAKNMKISAETINLVFAGQGNGRELVRRSVNGGHAKRTRNGHTTMTLAQRIADARTRITGLQDALKEHLAKVDDTNVSDEQLAITSELNAKIVQERKGLDALVESEKQIASATASEHQQQEHQSIVVTERNGTATRRPFNLPGKKAIDPLEYLVRAGTVQLFAHIHHRSVDDVRRQIYGDDEATKVVVEWAMRAASAPAMTNVTGWAAELVGQVITDFMQLLVPKSIFPRLSALGLALTFGRNGRIIVPTRSTTPTIAGSFVGEGQPIPVRQGLFTSTVLTPKKMAVITTWTREIDEHSVPAIEGLLRQAIQEDTAIAIDSVLLDTNAATAIRPAGILNGVTPMTPTAGGGFNALVGDIKQVSGALLAATQGHVRNPCWLMNPQQVNSISLTAMPGYGAFPFKDEVSRGQLQSWPIIDSGTVPLGEVVAIDAADFVSVGSEGPRFEISDQATLHMEDTTPLAIGSAGTPPTVAAPARSLWQTDSMALRLILPMNWVVRRAGVVAYVPGVTW